MKQSRRTPFGYTIADGKIRIHEPEAEIVREIFRCYRQGGGYQQIADKLAKRQVRYNQDSLWNKHMVKRILENERLTGTEDYPPILSEEEFREAAEVRAAKMADCDQTPPLIQAIRRKMVCAVCGSEVIRHTKTKGRPRWECPNRCRLEVREPELTGQVLRLLNLAAALPPLPEPGAELNVLRLRRELDREWDKLEPDVDFGGKWLSDYVNNDLGGFLTEETAEQKSSDRKLIGDEENELVDRNMSMGGI